MTLVISKVYTTWAPDLLSPSLWLDASNSSTLFTADTGGSTPTDGQVVGRWVDLGPTGGRQAIQATNADRPLYRNTGLNSKPSVEFAATDFLSVSGFTWASAAFSAFFVLQTNITLANQFPALLSENNESNNGFLQLGGNGDANPLMAISRTGQATSSTTTVIPRSSPGFISYSSTGISSGSVTVSCFANGTSAGNVSLSSLSAGVTASTIGRSKNGTADQFTGFISEIVALPINVSVLDRQKLEGYLAHKWGLTANLPNDHPYKWSKPPV